MNDVTYVYIIRYGFYYEHDNIFGVYKSRYKAKKAIDKHTKEGHMFNYYNEASNGYITIFKSVLI